MSLDNGLICVLHCDIGEPHLTVLMKCITSPTKPV